MHNTIDLPLLSRIQLLHGISAKEIAALQRVMEVEELPALHTPIIKQGEHCKQLLFLIEGELLQTFRSADGCYSATRRITAPCAIEPESLYSLNGRYSYSYQTLCDCRFISMRRGDVTERLMDLEAFRINFVNALSLHIQRCHEQLQPMQSDDAEHKFWAFAARIFPTCGMPSTIEIRMEDLARYIGETRLTVSHMLRRMQSEGKLQQGRGRIILG